MAEIDLDALREASARDLHAAMLANGEAISLNRADMGDDLYEQHRQAWREYVDVVLRRYAPVFAEVDRLRAQLDKPCGSCHPCTNWPAETWRQAGQRLPDVHQYGEMVAERDAMRPVVEAARAWRSYRNVLVAAMDAYERALGPDAVQPCLHPASEQIDVTTVPDTHERIHCNACGQTRDGKRREVAPDA